ncbi:hypothetical protein [Pseudanabaena mucicola]|uniref:Uncharacterized protein n=1 Tax=Pseudanabaena mucicola FACHB-723 TaxID=2692860 RepID=A0ABR8A0N1_9CYAN|nr:hypothetical protein [Pseudanabaena mucicola]MBD2189350.1 hypothetical protein [Pseudanabaena mucicola FACHB-723]
MLTYSQVEQALRNLGYTVDFNLNQQTKLVVLMPVEGYQSPVVLEFREGWKSELGDVTQLLQVEWLMDDQESCLFLDFDSLDEVDDMPNIFTTEKVILRNIFDKVLAMLANVSES